MEPPKKPIAFDEHAEKKRKIEQEKSLQEFVEVYKKSTDPEASTRARENFLAAWKQGVIKLGVENFNLTCSVHEIKEKWQAPQNFEFIRKTILNKSHGQQVLLALMYSFYDPIEGHKLCELVRMPNFVDARAALDDEGIKIISELWLYYTGW